MNKNAPRGTRDTQGSSDARPLEEHVVQTAQAPRIDRTVRPEIGTPEVVENGLVERNVQPATQHEPVRRMRWTRALNLHLLRAYFTATKNGDERTGYRRKLKELWDELDNGIECSEQRLSDQARSLLRRKVFSDAEIETLKGEAEQRFADQLTTATPQTQSIQEACSPPRSNTRRRSTLIPNSEPDHVELLNLARDTLEAYIFRLQDIDPHLRPQLPKLVYKERTLQLVKIVNDLIEERLGNCNHLVDTHYLIYCAASTVLTLADIKIPDTPTPQQSKKQHEPPWEKRLKNKITSIRQEIGVLTNFLQPNRTPSRSLTHKVKKIARKARIPSAVATLTVNLKKHNELLKQKISAYANRIKRYKQRTNRYRENKLFSKNPKAFYRNLEADTIVVKDPPPPDRIHSYWENIWGKECTVEHPQWMQEERQKLEQIPAMPAAIITAEDVTGALKNMSNWAAPGRDHVQSYWWKYFTNCHVKLAAHFQDLLENPTTSPNFITEGITILLPKNQETQDPKNYRPITCLPTIYKLFTAIISRKIASHIHNNTLLAWEQNGCRPKARGSKELLILDSIITQHAYVKNRNISVGWVDYRKAFDSVPHAWLLEVLEWYKIDGVIISCFKALMANWKTTISLKTDEQTLTTNPICIKRGIFQGDSLSPLWFCLALNPLSSLLNASPYGFTITPRSPIKVTHFFYVDDLKIYSGNQQQLTSLLEIVKSFSNAIKMELGIDKCAVVNIKKGKLQGNGNVELMDGTVIRQLAAEERYKYLGMEQMIRNDTKHMKESTMQRLVARTRAVLKTSLCSRAKTTALNTWALPVMTYSFGVLKWSQTDIEAMDRKIRTLFTEYRSHHPRSSINRLYLPRNKGGRGLLKLEDAHNKECYKLSRYIRGKNIPLVQAIVNADKGYTPLHFSTALEKPANPDTLLEQSWKAKELHSVYYKHLHSETVDFQYSVYFLKQGYLAAETEGSVLAIQDQVIATRAYLKRIAKMSIESDQCRLCNRFTETVQHLLAGCSFLAPQYYLTRHDNMGKIIHQGLGHQTNILTESVPFYKYTPQPVLENAKTKILWDISIQTDRTIPHNRPDIVILNKQEKTAALIDITNPQDNNVDKAYLEKIAKYLDLAHEIKDLWNLEKVNIIPLVISANGLVHKNLPSHLKDLQLVPGTTIAECQKAVLLGSANIIRKFVTEKALA